MLLYIQGKMLGEIDTNLTVVMSVALELWGTFAFYNTCVVV